MKNEKSHPAYSFLNNEINQTVARLRQGELAESPNAELSKFHKTRVARETHLST